MKICGGNMDRAIRLIVIGIMPLILGFVLNWLLMILPITGFFMLLLSLLFLIVWGYAAFKISSPSRNFILQAFLMCIFGLLMLILVLYQELAMGEYWGNLIGVGTQMFFLPWISLASTIIRPFMNVTRVWPLEIAIWIVLFILGCIGCIVKQHK